MKERNADIQHPSNGKRTFDCNQSRGTKRCENCLFDYCGTMGWARKSPWEITQI